METVFVQSLSYFKPSPEKPSESPKLEYVDALFKRRLSQISRMTVGVVHDVLPDAAGAKIVFASFRGELCRQLKINKSLVEDGEVLPAQFSLSVFNTPPAVATIALGITAGYTAVFPREGRFFDAFMAACAPILCGKEKKIIFVYADEAVPAEYGSVFGGSDASALAFACVLGGEETPGSRAVALSDSPAFSSPARFLESICKAS